MRCEFCQGSGLSVAPTLVVPCKECGGFGTLHPCEGLRAQPQAEISQVINEFDMVGILDWAAKSNQHLSDRFMQYIVDEDNLICWNAVATECFDRA